MERKYEKGRWAKTMMKGLLLSAVISMGMLLLLALVMLKLQPDTQQMKIGIMATYALSCLFGGWYCGGKMHTKKYLWGLFLGGLYFLLLFLVSGMNKGGFRPELFYSLMVLGLCCLGGMLGGMAAR